MQEGASESSARIKRLSILRPASLSHSEPFDLSALTALSPVDGRYGTKAAALRPFFSEFGLIRYRVIVEIRWLITLAENDSISEVPAMSESAKDFLEQIISDFSIALSTSVEKKRFLPLVSSSFSLLLTIYRHPLLPMHYEY